MAILPVIKRGLYLAGRIDKKYNINKIFIDKYAPPGYRKTLNRIVDIGATLGGGYGIYNFAQSLIAEDSPGNSAPIPFKKFSKTGKSYKTRGRFPVRSSRRYCKPTNAYRRRRQPSSSKYY